MYPDEFDYYAPADVAEALTLLEEHADANTELLAGGHSLLPTMKTGLADPDVLIDIGQIDAIGGIDDRGDEVTIGAMATYSEVVETDLVRAAAPALADAAAAVGDRQVRNMGTIGGNIAHADPASDLPGAVIAADATLVAEGPSGERRIPVDDFFLGMYATALADDEILTRIEVPKSGTVGSYAKKASPSSGYAMVGVATQLELDGRTVRSADVGANGAMDHGVRLEPVEEALVDRTLDADLIDAAASRATEDLDVAMMMEDMEASPAYRANLLEVYTRRALQAATDRIGTAAAD
jgi:carbon-monoxide dehydrogenase medium subunit